MTRHIIGRAFRRPAAVLVTEYLKDRFSEPHSKHPRSAFKYEQKTKLDGTISGYDVMVLSDERGLDREKELLEACRAFLVGHEDGDHVWA